MIDFSLQNMFPAFCCCLTHLLKLQPKLSVTISGFREREHNCVLLVCKEHEKRNTSWGHLPLMHTRSVYIPSGSQNQDYGHSIYSTDHNIFWSMYF